MLEVVKASELTWDNLLLHSFNHSCDKYGYDEVDRYNQIRELGEIYVVLREDRFIGFFLYGDDFKLFMYPRACPMSLRSLLKAALLRTMLDNPKTIVFSTWHPSLVSYARTILPNMRVDIHSPSDMECTATGDFSVVLQKEIEDYPNISSYDHFKVI